MGNVKEIQLLENSIFDIIESMQYAVQYNNIENYRLGLAVMDELNNEYKSITGQAYVPEMKVLEYYENQWSKFQ